MNELKMEENPTAEKLQLDDYCSEDEYDAEYYEQYYKEVKECDMSLFSLLHSTMSINIYPWI